MTALHRLRLPTVLLLGLVLQTSVLVRVRFQGVHAEALLVVALAAGIAAGPERGALVGFAAGLVADLFLETPFGLSALTYSMAAFAVGSVESAVIRPTWWVTPMTVLAGSAVGVALFVLVGVLVGQGQLIHDHAALVVGVVSLANAFLAVPVVPLVRWALPGPPEPGYPKPPR